MLKLLQVAYQPRHFLLPLALVAICAPGITFLGTFWLTGRWIILGLLAVYTVFFSVSHIRASLPAFTVAVVGYVAWCALTYGWSKVPDLSLMKTIALVIVVFACFRGGYQWVAEHKAGNGIDFLWPWTILALVAWLSGTAETSTEVGDSFVLHQGATGNSNFLGLILATSTPILLLQAHRNWANFPRRMIWLALLAICTYGLYQSGSRASYLLFVSVACGLLAAQGAGRAVIVPVVIAVIAGIVTVAAPYLSDQVIQRNIYKDPDSGDIFSSREGPWEESYEAALEGGLLGLGYGVALGEYDFEPALTAMNYGREKGNTPLAVVEETGLIGLTLYLSLIAMLFWELAMAFWKVRNKDEKTMLGIVIGMLFGLTVHSMFEAWWVAPGSVEFGLFWAIAGAGCAMAQAVINVGILPAAARQTPVVAEKA